MTPKKVWGVIIIVVGIYLVLTGFTNYQEADYFLQEIKHMERQFTSQSFQVNLLDDRTSNQFAEMKTGGIAAIVLGILFSIGGTLLLSNRKRSGDKVNKPSDI
jgi:drug/metabolite transporter (DMT)-like permease